MAGEDAVTYSAAVQGEAHMRAAVIEREDFALLKEDEDNPSLGGHYAATLFLQLLEATDPHAGGAGPGCEHGHDSSPLTAIIRPWVPGPRLRAKLGSSGPAEASITALLCAL